MQGIVQQYDAKEARGIIRVIHGETVQRYYLLLSKVNRSPVEIRAGQIATFERWFPPKKPGFLPVALGVEIKEVKAGEINVTQGLGTLATLALEGVA